MLEIDKIKPEIAALCKRLYVRRLELFGSAVTKEFGPGSDVDFLVEFDRGKGDLFNWFFELKEELERLVSRPVDVIVTDAIRDSFFRKVIEQTRTLLYAA
ncbi:MAG: nucleotidyltransferase domain-containing protein [Acidobacteria bacterium]|nr:nucleotidyltransferase domain-containing protein [Acidobacteriota bacterium]